MFGVTKGQSLPTTFNWKARCIVLGLLRAVHVELHDGDPDVHCLLLGGDQGGTIVHSLDLQYPIINKMEILFLLKLFIVELWISETKWVLNLITFNRRDGTGGTGFDQSWQYYNSWWLGFTRKMKRSTPFIFSLPTIDCYFWCKMKAGYRQIKYPVFIGKKGRRRVRRTETEIRAT